MTSKIKAFALAAAALVGVQAAPAQAARCIDDGNAQQLSACKESLNAYIEHRNQEPLRIAFAGIGAMLTMLGGAALLSRQQQQARVPVPARSRNKR